MKYLFAVIVIGFAALKAPGAAYASDLPEERFKAAVNQIVQKVRHAESPAEKRKILAGFLDRIETGLAKAGNLPALTEAERVALQAWSDRFGAYKLELDGPAGHAGVPDADLDRFAGYLQQDMEQAHSSGGIYISAGALLVAILVLIILL